MFRAGSRLSLDLLERRPRSRWRPAGAQEEPLPPSTSAWRESVPSRARRPRVAAAAMPRVRRPYEWPGAAATVVSNRGLLGPLPPPAPAPGGSASGREPHPWSEVAQEEPSVTGLSPGSAATAMPSPAAAARGACVPGGAGAGAEVGRGGLRPRGLRLGRYPPPLPMSSHRGLSVRLCVHKDPSHAGPGRPCDLGLRARLPHSVSKSATLGGTEGDSSTHEFWGA